MTTGDALQAGSPGTSARDGELYVSDKHANAWRKGAHVKLLGNPAYHHDCLVDKRGAQ